MAKPVQRKKKYTVDFTGVEGGGRSCADGRYLGKIKSFEEKEGQDSGQPYLLFKWSVNGATVYDNCSLQPQALWRLKGLLLATGNEVPDGVFEFDPSELIDAECGVEITNEDYQGKDKPRITEYFSADMLEEEAAEEKTATTSKPAAGKKIVKGSKVKFDDEEGKSISGVVTEIQGDNATVDVKGEEWEVEMENLSLA